MCNVGDLCAMRGKCVSCGNCVCVCSERKVCVLRDTGVLWRGSACVFCRGTGVL